MRVGGRGIDVCMVDGLALKGMCFPSLCMAADASSAILQLSASSCSGIKELSDQPFDFAGKAVFGQGRPDALTDAGKILARRAGQALDQAGRGLCRLG